ncbi:MAG: tetratricopeptide repeat protein [Candidatus Xenobia bacterium]
MRAWIGVLLIVLLSVAACAESAQGDYDAAQKALRAGRVADAMDLADRALRFDPTMAKAYLLRGVCHARLNQPAQAIADYNSALRIDNKLVAAWVGLGEAASARGDWQEGLEDLSRGINLGIPQSDAGDAFCERARCQAALKRYQGAADDASQAITYDPQNATAWLMRGRARSQLGKLQDAVNDCSSAIRLNPNYGAAYRQRAMLYNSLGMRAAAQRDLQRARALGK